MIFITQEYELQKSKIEEGKARVGEVKEIIANQPISREDVRNMRQQQERLLSEKENLQLKKEELRKNISLKTSEMKKLFTNMEEQMRQYNILGEKIQIIPQSAKWAMNTDYEIRFKDEFMNDVMDCGYRINNNNNNNDNNNNNNSESSTTQLFFNSLRKRRGGDFNSNLNSHRYDSAQDLCDQDLEGVNHVLNNLKLHISDTFSESEHKLENNLREYEKLKKRESEAKSNVSHCQSRLNKISQACDELKANLNCRIQESISYCEEIEMKISQLKSLQSTKLISLQKSLEKEQNNLLKYKEKAYNDEMEASKILRNVIKCVVEHRSKIREKLLYMVNDVETKRQNMGFYYMKESTEKLDPRMVQQARQTAMATRTGITRVGSGAMETGMGTGIQMEMEMEMDASMPVAMGTARKTGRSSMNINNNNNNNNNKRNTNRRSRMTRNERNETSERNSRRERQQSGMRNDSDNYGYNQRQTQRGRYNDRDRRMYNNRNNENFNCGDNSNDNDNNNNNNSNRYKGNGNTNNNGGRGNGGFNFGFDDNYHSRSSSSSYQS